LGLLLILEITVVSLGVFSLDTVLRTLGDGPRVTVLTEAARGIQPGSTVWVGGRPVGRVLSVGFRPPGGAGDDNVVIHAVLHRTAREVLRADATATLQAAALLEPVVIAIDPGTGAAPPWRYTDTLRSARRPLDPEALLRMSDTLRVAGEALAAQAADTRRTIRLAGGSLAALARDPLVVATAADDLERFRRFMADDYPAGTLARLFSDTVIPARLTTIQRRLERLDGLPGRRRARTASDEAQAAIDDLRIRFAALSSGLDRGEGSAGRLLWDTELSDQIALLRARLDSTVVELVRDPSRWLRLKVF
jgi:hypothetical protein